MSTVTDKPQEPQSPQERPAPGVNDEHPNPMAYLGVNVISYLLSGPLTFGGIGWLLDRWLGTDYLVAIGVLAGMGLAFYVIWFRYGRS